MEDKRKRLLRYLNDSYAAEVGGLMSLKDLAMMAGDEPLLQSAIQEHIRVTQYQAERLRSRILALGGDKSEPKAIVNSVIAKGSSIANLFHDKQDKLTQDLIKAYSFEHFEIGAYLSLRTYAEAIGDTETALLASQILDEERMAAQQMEQFIPACARQAVYRTTEFNSQPESNSGFLGIPPAAFLIPGVVLAYWGVNKWMENRDRGSNANSGNNVYRTATNTRYNTDYGTNYEYAGRGNVVTADTVMPGTSRSTTTVYSGENVYVPSSLEDRREERSSSSLNSGTVTNRNTFGGSNLSSDVE